MRASAISHKAHHTVGRQRSLRRWWENVWDRLLRARAPSHQSLPSSVNPRCLRDEKKRRIDVETPQSGECPLERIFYQRGRRSAVSLFLLLCAGVASAIYFEVQQPMEPPVAAVAPTRRPPAAPTDHRAGNFKIVGIDGWTVKSIKNNHITLVVGDKEIELNASDQDTRQGLSPSPGPPLAGLSPLQPPAAGTSGVQYRDPDAPPAALSAIDPPSPGTTIAQYRDPDAPPAAPSAIDPPSPGTSVAQYRDPDAPPETP
jgi:hypothetical protein